MEGEGLSMTTDLKTVTRISAAPPGVQPVFAIRNVSRGRAILKALEVDSAESLRQTFQTPRSCPA
jgi:hypothetical protein